MHIAISVSSFGIDKVCDGDPVFQGIFSMFIRVREHSMSIFIINVVSFSSISV